MKNKFLLLISMIMVVIINNPMVTYVKAETNNEESVCVLTEEEAEKLNKEVDSLFELRKEYILSNDIENAQIIEKRLEELGVSQISEDDAMSYMNQNDTNSNNRNILLNGVSTYDIPSKPSNSSHAYWTERTYHMEYNGVVYEIYELKESPGVLNGISYGTELQKTYASVTRSKSSISAAKAILKGVVSVGVSAGENALGAKAVLSTGLAIYDALKGICNGLTTTTTISNVQETYVVNATNEATFLFVKQYNGSDRDAIMAYSGNMIKTAVTCVTTSIKYGNNTYQPTNNSVTVNMSFSSEHYSSDRSKQACKNFYTYYHGNKAVNCSYINNRFTLYFVDGSSKTYNAPSFYKVFV